jgi:predicted HTH transcriptional regulator
MDNNDLKNIFEKCLKRGESECIEFKVDNFDKIKIGQRLSAISNSATINGKNFGYLIFGVNDQGRVVGTNFKPKKQKIGNEELEFWLNQMISPKINFKIYQFKYKDKYDIALIEIPAAPGISVSFQNVKYVRIGTGTRELKDYPEKEAVIWRNEYNKNFEKEVAVRKIDSDKILEMIDYPKYFELTDQFLPDNKKGILDNLIQEEFIIRDDSDSYKFSITNLGAILFAKNLQSFKFLKRKAPRVIIYNGKSRVETIKEQEGTKGYASAFEGIVNYINDQLPSNEEIKKALRIDQRKYPEIAIRELVANALIHQDFSLVGSGPMIEIFSDRIEISNPGRPLIEVDRFIDHRPVSRNDELASFMRRVKFCEERGSGIDKVIFNIELSQLPAPNFEIRDNFTVSTLYSYQSLNKMSKEDKIRACYQHCCLQFVKNEKMSNETLRKRFDIDSKNYSTASRIIADTIGVGLIKIYDENASKRYKRYIPFWA